MLSRAPKRRNEPQRSLRADRGPQEFLREWAPSDGPYGAGRVTNASLLGATLDELEQAATLVHRTVQPTPQYAWPKLKQRAGCTVWVKHENHTPTGAFKVRGGLVYLDRLKRATPHVAGIVSATRGNHGQSIAFAAARAGIPATLYVPHGNSPAQNSAM